MALQEKDALQKAAAQLGFEVVHYDLNTIDDLEGAFAAGLRDDVTAFYISGEPLLFADMSRVMSLVTASGKPSVGPYPDWGRRASDVLFNRPWTVSHAGAYAGKILKGAKPGDLPIEQASKFILVINLKPQRRSHRRAFHLAGARRRSDRIVLARPLDSQSEPQPVTWRASMLWRLLSTGPITF